jgi:HK97 family phage major capsid protein
MQSIDYPARRVANARRMLGQAVHNAAFELDQAQAHPVRDQLATAILKAAEREPLPAYFEGVNAQWRARGWMPGPSNAIALDPGVLLHRDLNVAVGTAGGNMVSPQDPYAASTVSAPRSAFAVLPILQVSLGQAGTVSHPQFSSAPAATVLANETSAGAELSPILRSVLMGGKNISNNAEMSQQLLKQNAFANVLPDQLLLGVRTTLEQQFFGGSGSSGEMTGLINAGISTTVGTSVSWANICAVMASVEGTAGEGPLWWAVHPNVATILRQRQKNTNGPPILDNGRIGDYPVMVTANVGTGRAIFGNFADASFVTWGPVQLDVNPYGADAAAYRAGIVQVRCWATADCAVRQLSSFAALTGVT